MNQVPLRLTCQKAVSDTTAVSVPVTSALQENSWGTESPPPEPPSSYEHSSDTLSACHCPSGASHATSVGAFMSILLPGIPGCSSAQFPTMSHTGVPKGRATASAVSSPPRTAVLSVMSWSST